MCRVIRFTLCLSLWLMSSCNVLDKEPIYSISPDQLFTNIEDAEAAVIGAYSALLNKGYIGGRFTALPEVPSKNTIATTAYESFYFMNQLLFYSDNDCLTMIWSDIYTGIYRANLIIEKLSSLENIKPEEGKNKLIAEAKFLRAFHYFNLVQLFGDVPLITKYTFVANLNELQVPRTPKDEIYELIFDDLDFAEKNLPTTYPTINEAKGRATRYAATALLARIHLYRRHFDKAANKSGEILKKLGVSLPSYSSLVTNQLTDEAIWEIQFNNLFRNDIVYYFFPGELGGRAWLKPSQDLLQAYQEGDLRKPVTVDELNKQPFVNKYFRITTGTDNVIVFRLAEIILTRAEALAELQYPNDESLELINIIRERAGLSSLTVTDVPDISSFQQAVWKERRLELAFEGHEWHDLVRTKRVAPVLGLTDTTKYLFPIPLSEIKRNPKLKQNPGY